MRVLVEPVPHDLSAPLTKMYADGARPSIPLERLCRDFLLQTPYSVLSNRHSIERLYFQPGFSLVCRPRQRRPGLSSDGLHRESRLLAGWRRGGGVPGGRAALGVDDEPLFAGP